jgi:predicted Zn-dependent protease
MHFFVMGHELAHSLCRHRGKILSWTLEAEPDITSGASSKLELNEVERSWNQELEADYVGLKLGLIVARQNAIPSETYCWSVYLLFRALTWCSLEPASSTPTSTPQQRWQLHRTHPPTTERLSCLQEIAREFNPSRPSGSDMISFSPIKSICDAVERLRLEWYG